MKKEKSFFFIFGKWVSGTNCPFFPPHKIVVFQKILQKNSFYFLNMNSSDTFFFRLCRHHLGQFFLYSGLLECVGCFDNVQIGKRWLIFYHEVNNPPQWMNECTAITFWKATSYCKTLENPERTLTFAVNLASKPLWTTWEKKKDFLSNMKITWLLKGFFLSISLLSRWICKN